MPTPAAFDTFSKLGAGALFLVAVFAFYTRRIRTRGEAEEDKVETDARLAEMRTDRDAWRSIAEAYGAKLDDLTRAVHSLVAIVEKIDRILSILETLVSGQSKLRDIGNRIRERVESLVAKVSA